ncbi:MAG TPA: hypothetical protein VL335_01720 [Candidatus Paceibacterota bacterium]|jgi:hypothetical protein|nr:hypothetical protein [Candidatus Paceibacterota bacterium]
MINKQLLDYISYKLAHGSSDEAIVQKILAEGSWTTADINEAFAALGRSVPENKKPQFIVPPIVPPISATIAPKPPATLSVPVREPLTPPPAPMPIVPKPEVQPIPKPTPLPETAPVSQAWEMPPREKSPASSFPRPSVPTPPLPQTSASHVFVAPVNQRQTSTHSGARIIIILLIVAILGGAGAYMYLYRFDTVQSLIKSIAGKSESTTAPSPSVQKPIKRTPAMVNNASYSFVLPDGWQASASSNDGQGVQASNPTTGFVVSTAITQIPKSAGAISSIDQIMTSDTTKAIIKSEFPGMTVAFGKVSAGMLGGEKAVIVAFTLTATSTTDGVEQLKTKAMLQYSAVHEGILYSVVFKSDLDKGLDLLKDAETIAGSFTFM